MLHSLFFLSSPGSSCLLDESRLAPPDKAWVYVLTFSTRLSLSPRRVAGLHHRTRYRSTLCLSPPGSACFLADYRARIAQQVLVPCFASLHQAQRVFSLSQGLASRNKALVHALLLSTRLSVTPGRVAVLHRRTRFCSKLCVSPPGSELPLAKSRARIIGQGLSPRFATLHQAQRFSSTSRGLAPWDKALVYALPLSTMLSGSPRRFACSHRRTRLGSTLSFSSPGSGCFLAESRAPNAGKGLVHALPLSTRISVSPCQFAG